VTYLTENKGKEYLPRMETVVHFVIATWRASMQAKETYIGGEQSLGLCVREEQIREFEEIIPRYLPAFHRRACRFLGNPADAEDAVQDAMLAAYKNLGQFRGQAQISTWLTTIVTNAALMKLRRRPRNADVSLDEPIGDDGEYAISDLLADRRPNPERECQSSELTAHIKELMTQLTPPLRKAFQLRELDGLTTSEAAQVLGVAEGTVKAQLARARAKLTKLMRKALDPKRLHRAYSAFQRKFEE
jgi:RNA polymerase sigma-70 factor, ECF subfamily